MNYDSAKRWPRIVGAVVAAAIIFFAAALEALPRRGGSGGESFSAKCASGGVLVGIRVLAGHYVNALAAICADLDENCALKQAIAQNLHGGNEGQRYETLCEPGSALIGIHGRSGIYVDTLGIRCGPLRVVGGVVRVEKGVSHPAVGGQGGSPFDDECPSAQVGQRLNGRAGRYLDQIELVCATVAKTRGEAATPGKGPLRTG
jgi:hypothetical protein